MPHWINLLIFAIWIIPIPKIVDLNITAIHDADIGLSSRQIKITSLFFGMLWPLLLLHSILRFLLGTLGIK